MLTLRRNEKERGAFFRSFTTLFTQRGKATAEDELGGHANLKMNNIMKAERIDLTEAQWLIDRLLADGVQDENEAALLTFIKDECPDIDAALQSYLSAS